MSLQNFYCRYEQKPVFSPTTRQPNLKAEILIPRKSHGIKNYLRLC